MDLGIYVGITTSFSNAVVIFKMMKVWRTLIDKLVNYWETSGIIESKDKELYIFGLRQGLLMLGNLCAFLIIGCFMQMTGAAAIFLGSFVPLRMYVGGYHAKTPTKCFILSCAVMIIALMGVKYLEGMQVLCILIITISSLWIYYIAPFAHQNRPLGRDEIKRYKKRGRIILGILLLLIAYNWNRYSYISLTMAVAILGIALSLIAQKYLVE